MTRVLLIGGDREILEMTAKILTRSCYDVTLAVGHAQAGEALRQYPFALVIFDCDMTDEERISLIRAIKDGPHSPPLLLISGSREDEVPLLRSGADDWVQKPYHMNVLLARMAALLRQSEKRLATDAGYN